MSDDIDGQRGAAEGAVRRRPAQPCPAHGHHSTTTPIFLTRSAKHRRPREGCGRARKADGAGIQGMRSRAGGSLNTFKLSSLVLSWGRIGKALQLVICRTRVGRSRCNAAACRRAQERGRERQGGAPVIPSSRKHPTRATTPLASSDTPLSSAIAIPAARRHCFLTLNNKRSAAFGPRCRQQLLPVTR